MKMSIGDVLFFVFSSLRLSHKVNTMAIRDELEEKKVASVRPAGQECSSHSACTQTVGMEFMELSTHSVCFCLLRLRLFLHIVMFIFLFKSKKYFSPEQEGSNARNVRRIVSHCL